MLQATTTTEHSAELIAGAEYDVCPLEKLSVRCEQVRSLLRHLAEIQDREHRRMGQELHDETGQALTSLMVGLALLEHEADDPHAVLARKTMLVHLVEEIMENLHRFATDLYPAHLDRLGLVPALRQHCMSVAGCSGLVVQFKAACSSDRLPPETEIAVYRIVQEALTNVVRHARATRADVVLEQRNGKVRVIVEDDGSGFDLAAGQRKDRLGLFGMQGRARALGGTLTVESTPGAGTTIVVEVPCGD